MRIGSKVVRKGVGKKHVGTVVAAYGKDAFNVRFAGGEATVDICSLVQIFWSNELKSYGTIPDVY